MVPGRSVLHRLLALAAAVAWLGSCSGEKSFYLPSVDAGLPVTKYAAVCAAWAQAECALESSCYVSVGLRWLDGAQCEQRRTIWCELEASDPDVSFDPTLVAGCTFTDCSKVVGVAFSPSLCLPPGRAPDGASCVWDDACAGGNCAVPVDEYGAPAAACGLCETLHPCTCGPDEECHFVDGGFTCLPLPTQGETCGPPLYSCTGSECMVPANASTGTCIFIPTATLGEPCNPGTDSPECVGVDPYCDPTTSTCAVYQPGIYGDPCTDANGGGGIACIGGGVCDLAVTGRCLPPSPDADPCDAAQGLNCLAPAECLNHACVFPSTARCSQ
jgi:hypothetical protein